MPEQSNPSCLDEWIIDLARLQEKVESARVLATEAARNLEKRLNDMNEFRAEMIQDKALYVNRLEWNAGRAAMDGKVDMLETGLYNKLGKEYEGRIEERFRSVEKRAAFTERMIWLACGAISIISILLRFINISPK